MKKPILALALNTAAASLFITACGEKTTEKITEVAVGDVSCVSQELKDKSGIKIVCNGDSIGVVLNGEKGDKGDAGIAGENGVGCSITSTTDSTATIQCGDDRFMLNLNGGSIAPAESIVVDIPTLSGYSQKGPFVNGTKVHAYEMENGKDLTQTGRAFVGTIENSNGLFSISNVALKSPYVQLTADGFYLNEVTGNVSKSGISLNAYTDLSSRSEVNVNMLTHLEFFRVKNLMEEGDGSLKLTTAKKQAQREIFAQFYIDNTNFGYSEDLNILKTGDQNAALLAISILLQGDRTEGELTSLLTNFGQDIKADGKWDDAVTRARIADWADSVDLGIGRFKSGMSLELIRQNVEGWKLGTVPDFEKYMRNFWYKEYGLGECNASVAGIVKNVTNKLSDFYSSKYEAVEGQSLERFVCSNKDSSGKAFGEYRWRFATDLEKDTYGAKCPEIAGTIFDGIINKTNKYVCDGGDIRAASQTEIKFNRVCVAENQSTTFIPEGQKSTFKCVAKNWIFDVPTNKITKGLIDSRDSKAYDIVVIGNQTWMAENLNYDYNEGSATSDCSKDNVDSCAKYGRYYTWAAAMDSAALFSTNSAGCGNDTTCSVTYPARGACPEGWHIPSNSEWETLYEFMGKSPFAMQATGYACWASATDEYGFSALPTFVSDHGGVQDNGFGVTDFWSNTEVDARNAYSFYIQSTAVFIEYNDTGDWYSKAHFASYVRCLQD